MKIPFAPISECFDSVRGYLNRIAMLVCMVANFVLSQWGAMSYGGLLIVWLRLGGGPIRLSSVIGAARFTTPRRRRG